MAAGQDGQPERDMFAVDRDSVMSDPDAVGTVRVRRENVVSLEAFGRILEEDTDGARMIVRDMSGRDRAILSFWLRELEDIIDAEEVQRRSM
jgi:hypothetical protein